MSGRIQREHVYDTFLSDFAGMDNAERKGILEHLRFVHCWLNEDESTRQLMRPHLNDKAQAMLEEAGVI